MKVDNRLAGDTISGVREKFAELLNGNALGEGMGEQ